MVSVLQTIIFAELKMKIWSSITMMPAIKDMIEPTKTMAYISSSVTIINNDMVLLCGRNRRILSHGIWNP